jgi:hypothetical protein
MLANTGLQPLATHFVHKIANVIRLSLIEDRDHVYLKPGAREGHSDAVGVADDLIVGQNRLRLDDPVANPADEPRRIIRRSSAFT